MKRDPCEWGGREIIWIKKLRAASISSLDFGSLEKKYICVVLELFLTIFVVLDLVGTIFNYVTIIILIITLI